MTVQRFHLPGIATATILIVAMLLPFISYAPNRVAESVYYSSWSAGGMPGVLALLAGILAAAAAGFRLNRRLDALLPAAITLAALIVLSLADRVMPPGEVGAARIGGGAGFWIWILTAYLYGVTSENSSRTLLLPVVLVLIFLLSGLLDQLGPVKEFVIKKDRFFNESAAHLSLSISATAIASLIAIPAGIIAYRNKSFGRLAFTGANIIQTLPSLALFGLMIAPLAWLSMRFPLLRSLGIKGVGNFPALIALSGYAALPILRNTYTGLEVIPDGAIMAGRGMGMSPWKLLGMVEIPLALPVILGGFRIAFVQAIGNTTVAALIGAGGLGNFVFQGLGQAAPDLILLGVVPLIALAVAADGALKLIERLVTPKPFREAP